MLTATYRLQMNAGFTLAQARERVEYLATLGVSHLYLSPIFAARRGSMHGYDVVDPTRVNPEIGSEADLRVLSQELHRHGMGLVLDVVPNHMGIGRENPYWDDVLANGERSPYARWFDIDWIGGHELHRKVTLPVLGDDLDAVVDRGEMSVELV
ncbi:MAG TPA: alpha-amylase family glycosyl hydrolase, partial [Gemmatimonadaceae bacterium]